MLVSLRGSLTLLALTLMTLPSGAARADRRDDGRPLDRGPLPFERITIARVEVIGASPAVAERLRQAVAGGLAAADVDVVEAPPAASSELLERCDTPTCAQRLAERTGAARVVRGRVEVASASYGIELALADGRDGHAAATVRDRCEVCTLDEASAKVSALARALVAKAPEPPPAPPPPVASLDGAHAARPGWIGVTKWVTAGVAAALFVTAIAMLAENGRPACDAPAGVMCERLYDTAIEGGVFLTLGLAAGVASGALFWWDRIRPQATVTSSGGSIGARISF